MRRQKCNNDTKQRIDLQMNRGDIRIKRSRRGPQSYPEQQCAGASEVSGCTTAVPQKEEQTPVRADRKKEEKSHTISKTGIHCLSAEMCPTNAIKNIYNASTCGRKCPSTSQLRSAPALTANSVCGSKAIQDGSCEVRS